MCAYLLESLDLASTARHSEMLPRRPPRLYDGSEYPLPLPPSLPTCHLHLAGSQRSRARAANVISCHVPESFFQENQPLEQSCLGLRASSVRMPLQKGESGGWGEQGSEGFTPSQMPVRCPASEVHPLSWVGEFRPQFPHLEDG